MSNSTDQRMPSLDGIRAISILLVLYGHLSGTRHFPVTNATYGRWFGDVAHLGVYLFFVISGFLITSLLTSEREVTGTISLKQFYLRRVLRIFPAFYAFVMTLAIAAAWGGAHLTGRDFAYALTFTFNYSPDHPWLLGHLWSLSIEEQFYLLWPVLFVFMRARHALIVAIAAIFASALLRAAIRAWVIHAGPLVLISKMTIFPAMCDYLAAGCALAMLRPWLLTQGWYLRLTSSRWLMLTVPVVLAINRVGGDPMAILLGSPVTNVCLALLIESSTRHANSLAGRLLNWKPIAFIGTLSYSLYLWQEIFLDRSSSAWMNAFPQNMVFAFLAALASYFVIERAFVRLRRRLRHGAEPTDRARSHAVVRAAPTAIQRDV
ncbi:acyltransferase [Rhodanobacter sp. L36]|uniref:acyltransferase family protein n=1 Tax=Rhodanobacter sp. L36 TaxID=1747221 RepID=UPI00131BA90B|nr:acyltransferase [Rhodanobacter sp. L36]